MEFELTYKGEKNVIFVDNDSVSGKPYTLEKSATGEYFIRLNNIIYSVYDVSVKDEVLSFNIEGDYFEVPFRDEQALLLERMGFKSGDKKAQGNLKAPMPGKIIRITKAVGDEVTTGEALVILEAMKMENELKAPVSGTLETIHVEAGQSVEKNTILLEIK